MMIINELLGNVKDLMDNAITVTYDVEIKNNETNRPAFTFRKEGNSTYPIVYIDEYIEKIENGASARDLAWEIVHIANKALTTTFDLPTVSKKFILENVIYQLVNGEKNEYNSRNLFMKNYLDLKIIYRVRISEEKSFLITNTLIDSLGISTEELDRAAFQNTETCEFLIVELSEYLGLGFMSLPVYVIGISDEYGKLANFGASILLYKSYFRKLADQFDSNLIILPASIHELLVIPESGGIEPESALNIVKSVNSTAVSPEDFLSNSVYYYDKGGDNICRI